MKVLFPICHQPDWRDRFLARDQSAGAWSIKIASMQHRSRVDNQLLS